MKNQWLLFAGLIAGFFITTGIQAQEDQSESKFSAGADLYSNYIWRGTKLGIGPAVQPTVKFVTGGLTIGVWGSFDAQGYAEVDPYFSYAFKFGLSLGITDYYYPGLQFFETSDTAGSHAFEINAGYTIKGLSLSANYILNEAGGAGSKGNDTYFQASYAFKHFSLVLGMGDGWHTSDGDFGICHLGIGTTKVIKITDTFSIPVTGQVILNPEREQLYVVVGFSF